MNSCSIIERRCQSRRSVPALRATVGRPRRWAVAAALALCGLSLVVTAGAADYATDAAPLFTKYCTGCHNAEDREGDLSLERFDDLRAPRKTGPLVVPGAPDASRLIAVLTGRVEPTMPPEDSERPSAVEIERLRAWVAQGAPGPQGGPVLPRLAVPKIDPVDRSRSAPITALAVAPGDRRLAVGRFGKVDLVATLFRKTTRSLTGLPGKVQRATFSPDGRLLAVATGVTGLYGQVVLYDADSGREVRRMSAHRDAMLAARFSPDSRLLATASYDKTICLWEVETGRRVRTITGHNGAIFDVAFSPDGRVLASASADETIKVWKVATGERLDTLGQPQGEQYAVAFRPDGRQIAGGGADKRIRVWRLVSRDRPEINPLLVSRFAHEGTIVDLEFSPDGDVLVSAADDRSVKVWETQRYAGARLLPRQSDVVSAIALAHDGSSAVVGRLDGTWDVYPLERPAVPPPIRHRQEVGGQAAVSAAGGRPPKRIDEAEPNDTPATAQRITVPVRVGGVVDHGDGTPDADLYRFSARAGQQWLVEVDAARSGSALDSNIEILDPQGQPVPRVLLQAVRDSYFTFRGKDSKQTSDFRLHNWEEMKLNDYLYAAGEVVKLWLYPRGPDSGFIVYPGEGTRYTYFDTSRVTHALNEPCWIVRPHPIGTELIPNGLPVFTVMYENDDDSRREWGTDSRLMFQAPREGEYLVRVRDVRGFSGKDYRYELAIRRPHPDFDVTLEMPDAPIPAGGGREFRLTARRHDRFDGPIRVSLDQLPPGLHVTTPVVIEAGQIAAYGAFYAAADAAASDPAGCRVTATAVVAGREVTKDVALPGELKIGPPAKVTVSIHAASGTQRSDDRLEELTIAPGETISAIVRVERQEGFDRDIPFGKENAGRNLPHGVYIDNIGLNGLMVSRGRTEREFFITADTWLPETSRLFHLKARVDGDVTSWPVRLHVRAANQTRQAPPGR